MENNHMIKLFDPKPYQVIQRYGFNSLFSHVNNLGGPCLGFGIVNISGEFVNCDIKCIEFRTILLEDAYGKPVDWTKLDLITKERNFFSKIEIPAGGWYRLELRGLNEDGEYFNTAVDPIGVGEVFVIAGQSYATNCNDKQMMVEDPQGRISVYDFNISSWRIAHDRQPCFDNDAWEDFQKTGSIWPFSMDLLFQLIRVPIGMVNAGYGGTASREWLPGTANFRNLVKACKWASNFRYILWQQGESDVIASVDKETYVSNLVVIKNALDNEMKFQCTWVLAKSTLHPTVYVEPQREGWIRDAIEELCSRPGFLRGPDTDILGRDNRSGQDASAHFSYVGQKRAGLMWFSTLWNLINIP